MGILTRVLLTVVLWLPGTVAAETATARGAALAHTCVTCHGPDGRSQGAIPSLTTLSSEDISTALQAFRAETRQGTVMQRLAKGLDDADIIAVATYFATLPRR
jgi:sulfide dehydrogenase cytochrome subunit